MLNRPESEVGAFDIMSARAMINTDRTIRRTCTGTTFCVHQKLRCSPAADLRPHHGFAKSARPVPALASSKSLRRLVRFAFASPLRRIVTPAEPNT